MGHFATGVAVITTRWQGATFGMSASAVASLSLEPPMLLICLHARSATQAAVSGSRMFCVNILAEEQGDIARHFARPHSAGDKFASTPIRDGALGLPLIRDALAWLECRVQSEVQGATHRVFLSEVAHAQARPGAAPLAYYRGAFGRIETGTDERAMREVRQRVLERQYDLGTPLDVASIADDLGLRRIHVHHALLKLTSDGLVTHDSDLGYVVSAIDVQTSDDAFDARCAIELGVADLTVGRVKPQDVVELRRSMEATLGLISDGHFKDIVAYIQMNAAFHESMVSLAGSAALLDSYRRLSIPAIMGRLFATFDGASEELLYEHQALVAAYEQGDLNLAREVIRCHSERAKATNRRAIQAAGARV
jgi:flavin reductase (DIM6/NTAB) family NADH-FMN oxidoreductase RutF/DNA-binding transcriptional regulator YhcF (GntR family)